MHTYKLDAGRRAAGAERPPAMKQNLHRPGTQVEWGIRTYFTYMHVYMYVHLYNVYMYIYIYIHIYA